MGWVKAMMKIKFMPLDRVEQAYAPGMFRSINAMMTHSMLET